MHANIKGISALGADRQGSLSSLGHDLISRTCSRTTLLSSALSVNIVLPYFHPLRTTATFTARGFFPAMPQPELPEPAHAAVDSMLSRKFGKEVANYFSGSPSHNCLANRRAHLPRITLEQSFLLAN